MRMLNLMIKTDLAWCIYLYLLLLYLYLRELQTSLLLKRSSQSVLQAITKAAARISNMAMYDSSGDDEPKTQPQQQSDGNLELPSLFWDAIPEKAEDHPDWQAMQALRDECTPEERAENFKVQGNNKLNVGLKAKNKVLLREAVDFYSKGLAEKCSDSKLNAILLSNRAHVQSLLGNWRSALEDAQAAQKADPSNVKAFFRGARAALRLRNFSLCQQQCQHGRALDPAAAPEFTALEEEAAAGAAVEEAEAARQRAAEEEKLAPARALLDAITQRGYQVALPQMRTQDSWRPHLDSNTAKLSWPVVILYPEGATQDEIQAWEEQDTVKDQLDQMFGPDAPPLGWDQDHKYQRDKVELYYLSWAGRPLSRDQLLQALATGNWPDNAGGAVEANRPDGSQTSKWVKVKESWTLHELLSQHDFIIPGLPFLAAVARGTEYRQRFLSTNHA